MKINTLLEYTSPSSQPNQSGGQAPKFGRDPNVLEITAGVTSTGSVGADAKAMPGMQRRSGKGSMFQGIKTSKKFVNSPMTEDEISEEQLLAKQLRKELFKRGKDKELGDRPGDRDIISKEEFNGGGEYNDEVDMVQNNLHTIVRVSTHLGKELHANENMPEWVQEKIAVAKSMMVTVMDYMISQHERGNVYTVDDIENKELEETDKNLPDWMKDIIAMAHRMNPQDKMRERQAQRDAEAKAEQQKKLQQDIDNLPELIEKYKAMEAEYESMGGKNWQYADYEQNLSDEERKARNMEGALSHLANRIHRAKKASEELKEANPDFGKMFDKTIGKHNNQGIVKGKEDYLNKREHLQRQLNAPGLSKQDRDYIRQLLTKLDLVFKKQGIEEDDDTGPYTIWSGGLRIAGQGAAEKARQLDLTGELDKGVAEGPSEVIALANFAKGGGILGGQSPADVVDARGVAEGMGGKVVFSGTGDNGGKYEIIQSGDDFMIHVNGKHIDSYGSLQRAMSVLKNEVPGLKKSVDEESKGLWANIHAKRERIKHGSGERMRKPGSKGAPTKDALRKATK